jgi:glycerophosphoryl diester phosphodiesterase
LDQLVASHPDVIISLDMKAQETLNPLISWMSGRDTSNFIVGSFSHKRVQAFRKSHPQIRTALTTREVLLIKFGLARFVRTTPFSPKFAMVPARFKAIKIVTSRFIRLCERKNIQVHVWTVNSVSEVRHLKTLGVTGVVTDNYRILRGG